jgi:hypothetical protein
VILATFRTLAASAGLLVLTLAAPEPAPADDGIVVLTPKRLPVPLPTKLSVRDFGPDREPICLPVYLNESTGSEFSLPVGAGVELADDLHTSLDQRETLCAFDLGYFAPGPAPVNARVTFYDMIPGDGAPSAVMAGPYEVLGLPPGLNAFRIEVPPGGEVDGDFWMGVAFSSGDTGLLAFDPPTLGHSHDIAWVTPPGAPATFGGVPPANAFLGVHASPSTPARPSSWGTVKVLYR